MRPIPVIPTSSTSTSAVQQQRPTTNSTISTGTEMICNSKTMPDLSNLETNGRPFSNGKSFHNSSSEPKPTLSPSSSTLFSSSINTKMEVPVTKKPPPVFKKISLLSDSISKFEQNCDSAKPKVSWRSFIKPSASKDKLATSNTGVSAGADFNKETSKVKTKATDENNNDEKSNILEASVATNAVVSQKTVESKPKSERLITKLKETNDGSSCVELNTKDALSVKYSATEVRSEGTKEDIAQNDHMSKPIENETKLSSNLTTHEVEESLTTSPPPQKVKRIVKKIVKRTVIKTSTDSTPTGEDGGEKTVKVVKRKIIKSKPEASEVVNEPPTGSPVVLETTVSITANGTNSETESLNRSDVKQEVPAVSTQKLSLNDKLMTHISNVVGSEPIDIGNKHTHTPEIKLNNGSVSSDSPTSLLNERSPNRPSIRPIISAHKSRTVDLGASTDAILRPTLQSYQHFSKETSLNTERRRSWGKLDKLPLSLALSRDSTLDELSRESSLLSRSSSPYSQSTTRSSSVLSNYDSWQSSRSVTPRSLLSHSLEVNDSFRLNDCGSLEIPRRRSSVRSASASSEKSAVPDYLSDKIEHFLKRTDHVTHEWGKVGKSNTGTDILQDLCGTYQSKSVSSIMSRGIQLLKCQPSLSRSSSRMSSVSRDTFHDCMDDDNVTVVDDKELSDMTAELAEEHSSSNVISERLDAETTERLRLEKEVKEHETKYRNLQESSEKLEMELLCAKSDLNGDLDDDLEGDDAGSNAYRLKYERVARELEFTKKRLQTQHEHDLEQLIGLKKQLEKKLADAYEEVEEQRQVVGQWKRKAQKMTNEMNDLRMLLEEQNSRNNLLEKRQRKFDSECQALQDSARQEKQAKERLTREKDVLIAEKFTIEQTLSDVRLELELKEEKYSALQRELDEMTFGGGTEEEIAQLKRQKMELDRRCKEQEEELDEMAGQIQLLEQAKLRLEMSLETMRKGARKESQQRDEELEEVRGSSYKKIKTLECQLEQEHEERTLLLREKHELERRLNNLEEHDRSERAAEEAASQKLKRDLRKYKALLRDAQTQLERAKADSAGKALIRQLRNQLEDAESARSAAVKARQAAEGELQDVQLMLEEAQRARYDAEDKATSAQRDRTELQAQIDENEEEMAELMKKYSSTVKQLSSEQTIIADNEFKISELESEKKSLKEQIFELTSRLENVENIGDSSSSIQFKRLELRTKEIESRLELEQANRARTEVQLQRHKDSLEKAQHEVSQTRTKEMHAQEALKKSQKTIRELREELHIIANKEQESLAKRKDLEKRLESVEAEAASARADLRLALQRIADLQQAMEEGDSYHSDSENSDSSIDSVGEMSYRSPSSVTLRARSGQSNGTSTNGSSTTLCIREEKENTPRIRPKFNLIGLRRRRLPFTIHEEDEDESALTTTLGKAENDVSDGIDNCIESIKRTIGDGSESGLEQSAGPSSTLTDSPKYTGAIKKTINITVKSLKCNEPQKKSQSSLNEMRTKVDGESNNVSSKMCTDANNNLSENVFSKHVQSISDPNVASDLMDTSVVLANQIQNDSRFDLDALKSIKEKIKNLNRSLKEEAAQERCSRFEFPPLSTKPDVLVTEEPSINKDVTKLDQLEAQLNLDGIRSMKEKIQNLKKKLQEDSTSTMTANKEDIINEISEMKKALTVAFLNKGCERRSLSRSSSERDDSSTSSFKREDNSLHSLKSDQNSSSSLKSVDSSNLDLKQAKELTKPPAVNKLAPAHEEINNLSPTSYSGSMDSGPMRVSSLNQVSNSEIKRDPFAFATIDNVVERKLMVIGNDQSATVHNSPSTISCAVNKVLLEVDSSDEALKIESAIQPEADSRYIISADYNPVNDDINVRSKNDEPNVKTTTEGKCTMEAELHQLDINIISERNVGKSTINTIIEDTDSPQSQSTIFSNATLPFESAQRNDLLNSMMVHRMPIVSPLQSIVLENKLENTQLNSSFELELVKQIDVYDQNLIIDEHTQESEKVFPINQEEYIDDTTTESIGVVERHQHEVVKDGESLTNPEKNVSYKCDEPSDVESPYSTDIVERMESTDKEHLQVQTNSCFKTKDCRCENIDQTIEMLVTSMEQSSPSQSLSKPCIQSSIDMNSDTNDDIKSTMTTLSEDIDILPNINLTSADKHLADMTILTPVSTIDVSEQYTPVSLSNIDGNNNETNWIANSENEYIDPEENTKSNQTSQQATLTEFVAKNNIFSDLANGDFVETTTLQTPHKKVDESSLPINDPIEDIPNQVSERALAIDSSVLLNECSSRSVIPLHAIVVSTDVMTDTLVSTPASSSSKSGNLGQQQKPLSYAESLKKARSPPKSCPQHMTRSSALAEAKQACKTEPAAKTNRKPQHQSIHQRERHSSLARGGNNPSKDIRQSKSASKLNSKEISLPNGKPTELKQSKSVAQEQQNISLARKKNNRSNPNLLVDKKFSISNNGNGIKLEQPERNRHRTQAVNNKKK
ncbi:uncharacterized protein LOC131690615 isoform X6 [Topomyia yanbarensis]|uniref:uncharacterized protein LOC131690615 isoform X6 n=1 Tax=Topomyia yanbarensis TaxID=2498891 RepID=UPI00273BCBEC|nr:uncharacterized protein LOC131690615 isoform X6 [Topomyia yanbarensis]